MSRRSLSRPLAVLALLLAVRADADIGGESSPTPKDPAAEGALDTHPAPVGSAAGKDSASPSPPSAHSSAWRASARTPAEVPAPDVIRNLARKTSRPHGGPARGRDDDCTVEIIWHAPGT